MSVCLYIIESANYEQSILHFNEDKKVTHSTEKINDDFIDFRSIGRIVGEIFERYKKNVTVFFIDRQYRIDYYYTPEGIEENNFIKEIIKNGTIECEFLCSNWYDFVQTFDKFLDEDDHIFVTRKSFINCYDMANFLKLSPKRNFYFKWNLKSLDEILHARSYYNIFSSIPKNEQIDTLGNFQFNGDEDLNSINWIVEYGVSQVKQLILAGCLQRERFLQCHVESWVTNVFSPFSAGVIIEYDMYLVDESTKTNTIFQGQSPQKCFNELCDYRYFLVDYMCRCLCKYGLEFKKIYTANGDHQTINFDYLLM